MPSTRKQKAKERPSKQLVIMSDVENVYVMLGRHSRNDEGNDQSENLDSESNSPQRNSNLSGDDFKSLLTNSRENSEITIETTRLINEKISNQMSRRLNEIKTSLDSQIQNDIITAIVETVLPSIQNTLDLQGRAIFTVVDLESGGLQVSPRAANFTVVDRRSCGQQRNPEAENAQKTWKESSQKVFYAGKQ